MITRIDFEDIPGRATSYNGLVQQDIREFLESGWSVCEVSVDKYKTIQSAFNSYKFAVKRMKAPVRVARRSGRLFLISI